jgi:hypothetical protein
MTGRDRLASASETGGPARLRAPPFSRRRFVGGVVAAVLTGCGLVAGTLRTRGYRGPSDRSLQSLALWEWVVVRHAALRITAPDEAVVPPPPTSDEVDVAGFVDEWLTRLPQHTVFDLGRFLVYLEHVAPVGCAHMSRFTRLTPSEQDRVLASIESSESDLLRAGFEGLKALVFMGYYRDPRTWRILGYDGPFVGRPPQGWP